MLFANSILYLMLRALVRDSVTFEYPEDEKANVDRYEDFMSGKVKMVLLNVFAQACLPASITTILKFFFLNDDYVWSLSSNDASIVLLTF